MTPSPPSVPLPYLFLGVDPGRSGGLALLHQVEVQGKPYTRIISKCSLARLTSCRGLLSWLGEHCNPADRCVAVLEKVGGYVRGNYGLPGMGAAMFSFGTSYGRLEMALAACRIPYTSVSPAKWQRGLGITSRQRGEDRTTWKRRLLHHAQQLFPAEKITLATADALLLSEYCRLNFFPATSNSDRV